MSKPMSDREQRLRARIAEDLVRCADEIHRMPGTNAAGLVGDRIETSRRAVADTYVAAARRVVGGADRQRRAVERERRER